MSKKTRKKTGKATTGTKSGRVAAEAKRITGTRKKSAAKKTSTSKPAGKTAKAGKTTKKAVSKTKAKATSKSATKGSAATKKRAPVAPISPVRKVATLVEGDAAPAFFLPRDGGQSVSLAGFAGRKLVIFFYPRADTPGCTIEAMDFSRLAHAFAASQTAVLGVSADPVRAQDAFRDKHQLSVPLVSDEKHELLKPYGAWGQKSMYGKTFMGILRTTVLLDAEGQIARIWRNVKVAGHADEVLAAARTL